MSRSRSLAPKLALSAISLVVFFSLAEVAARTLGEFEQGADPLDDGGDEQFTRLRRFDPLLFWSIRPGVERPSDGMSINSHGLRGPEVPPKSEQEFRILSLGESSTFAGRVPYEECYSARLESLLGRYQGKRVRVVNAGVPGYTLFQGYQYLVHRGLELEPDAVLLYFGHNDFLPISYLANRAAEAGKGLNDRELFELRRSRERGLHELLLEHSHFYRGMKAVLFDEPASALEVKIDDERARVPEEDRRWLLEQLLDVCESRGIQLIVCVPWYVKFEDHAPLLREFADEHDLVLVDLPRLLQGPAFRPRQSFFLDRLHPTSQGHALIAQSIHDQLVRSGRSRR